MPKPLPLAWINVHSEVSLANSPALRVDGVNAVSVTAYCPAVGVWCNVVPQATIPGVVAPGAPAEFVQDPPTGTVASSFTTMDVGTAGVNVLLIRSLRADRFTNPFGVTGQEQQEIICSSGENAYTFTQIAPVVAADVPAANPAPRAPVLLMLITESPMFRLDAYRV